MQCGSEKRSNVTQKRQVKMKNKTNIHTNACVKKSTQCSCIYVLFLYVCPLHKYSHLLIFQCVMIALFEHVESIFLNM